MTAAMLLLLLLLMLHLLLLLLLYLLLCRYDERRLLLKRKQSDNSRQHLVAGLKGLGFGMLGGLTSVITEPIQVHRPWHAFCTLHAEHAVHTREPLAPAFLVSSPDSAGAPWAW